MASAHTTIRGTVGIKTEDQSGTTADAIIYGGTGAPTDGVMPTGRVLVADQTAIYLREDGTSGTFIYVTVDGGSTWTALDPTGLTGLDLNGTALVLDADGDTEIDASVDDTIDITIAAAVDFQMTANTFSVLTGSDLNLADSCKTQWGTGQDITMTWDGSDFLIAQATPNSAVKWGIDGAGMDQIFYGDNHGSSMTWDQSADSLLFTDDTPISFGDGGDLTLVFDGTNLVLATAAADTGALELGADGAGVDVIFYGDTAGSKVTWDQSADSLLITDSTPLSFGDGGDVLVQFDATNLVISTAVADTGAVVFGSSGVGVDVIFYGDTATYDVTWDQSADSLICNDNVVVALGTGSDEALSYDGTDFLWTHTSGEWILDVSGATDSAIIRLGTDDAATDFQVQNDSAAAVLTITGAGALTSTEGGVRPSVITDPGPAGAIVVTEAYATCSLTSTGAGAEARTLAIPTFAGQRLTMVQTVLGAGGDVITVTVASAFDVTAHTTIAFNAVWDTCDLIAMTVAGALHWVLLTNIGVVAA